MNRRWLVISYFTGLDWLAPSLHVDPRIAELRRRGHQVRVITSAASPPAEGAARVLSPFPSGLRYELRFVLRRRGAWGRALLPLVALVLAPFYLAEKLVAARDSTWSWRFPAARAVRREMRAFAPDVVLSTGGPPSAHVAAYRAVKGSGVPWIVELQDPLIPHPGEGKRREVPSLRRLERLIAAEADAVVYLTGGALGDAEGRASFAARTAVIRPGARPIAPEFLPAAPPGGETLDLVHFGSISPTRNLGPAVAALRALERKDPALAARVRLVQHGPAPADALGGAQGLGARFLARGRVSRGEMQRLMASAGALLLLQDSTPVSPLYIPSKTYEYLQTGRPILALVGNPELAAMLRELGHQAVEMGDEQAAGEALGKVARDFFAGRPGSPANSSPYTVAAAADEIDGLAGELAGRR